ncbi:MAG: hypothetical protein BWY64_00513 [bacterium ADurb.Bin363]|nr:MAG: hypothetical protein BWY64_00513 [bacterium ADurb.Bin363]
MSKKQDNTVSSLELQHESAENDSKDLKEIKGDSRKIKEDVSEVKEDSKEIKEDASEVKEDSKEIKEDASEVKEDSKEIKEDTSEVKEDSKEIKEDTSEVKEESRKEIKAELLSRINKRKIIAVGDLHGDYFRLIRFLKEEEIVILKNKDVFQWNPDIKNIDVVTLGDYCDWRGEPLEGPITEWIYGARKILDLLISLGEQVERLREDDKEFTSNIYCLLGNHDQMLLEGYESYKFFTEEEINFILENSSLPNMLIQEFASQREKVEMILKFLNWYQQGGEKTIASYGGIKAWEEQMEGSHKKFLANLMLGSVINKTLFSHSLPDSNQYWRPLEEILQLSDEEKAEAVMEFTWGRRIWGYDVFSGQPVLPLSSQQVENMLFQMKVERAVVGHTPMRSLVPVIAFNGKIINLDLHGIPGSKTLVEEFEI